MLLNQRRVLGFKLLARWLRILADVFTSAVRELTCSWEGAASKRKADSGDMSKAAERLKLQTRGDIEDLRYNKVPYRF